MQTLRLFYKKIHKKVYSIWAMKKQVREEWEKILEIDRDLYSRIDNLIEILQSYYTEKSEPKIFFEENKNFIEILFSDLKEVKKLKQKKRNDIHTLQKQLDNKSKDFFNLNNIFNDLLIKSYQMTNKFIKEFKKLEQFNRQYSLEISQIRKYHERYIYLNKINKVLNEKIKIKDKKYKLIKTKFKYFQINLMRNNHILSKLSNNNQKCLRKTHSIGKLRLIKKCENRFNFELNYSTPQNLRKFWLNGKSKKFSPMRNLKKTIYSDNDQSYRKNSSN